MSNVIYIELISSGDKLVIAVPVGDIGYHQPYSIVRVQHGTDIVADIRDSKFFTRHPISELPKEIIEDFDWRRKYHDNAVCFYKEIVQGDNFRKQATECMRLSMEVIDEYNVLLQNLPTNDIVLNKLPEIKEKLKRVLDVSKQINNG